MKFFKTVALTVVLAVAASVASAATVIATVDGNDPFPGNLVYVDQVYSIDTPALFKCDVTDNLGCKSEITRVGGEFKIGVTETKNDGGKLEGIAGTWSWSMDGLAPHYMVTKAGNAYSIWDLGTETSGLWDTRSLDGKGISHISFYNTGITEVALPASAFLLLGGLGGLVALRRRKS